MSKKICMYCGVEMKPIVSSPNEIYGADDPLCNRRVFMGDYFCPNCRRGNCGVSIPLTKDDIENLQRCFSMYPQNLKKCVPEIKSFFKENPI